MNLQWLNPNYLPTPLLEQSRCEQEVRELHEIKYAYEQIDSDLARSKVEWVKKRLIELWIWTN